VVSQRMGAKVLAAAVRRQCGAGHHCIVILQHHSGIQNKSPGLHGEKIIEIASNYRYFMSINSIIYKFLITVQKV